MPSFNSTPRKGLAPPPSATSSSPNIWKAIYNDDVIRVETDALYGAGRVLKAPGHGPDKLHIHLDLRPLAVTKDDVTGYKMEQGHMELPAQTP